jgi:hypothetical protein
LPVRLSVEVVRLAAEALAHQRGPELADGLLAGVGSAQRRDRRAPST